MSLHTNEIRNSNELYSSSREKSSQNMELKISFMDLYVYFERKKKKKVLDSKKMLYENIQKYKQMVDQIKSKGGDTSEENRESQNEGEKTKLEQDLRESKFQSGIDREKPFELSRDVLDAFEIIEKIAEIPNEREFQSKTISNAKETTNRPQKANSPKSLKTFQEKSAKAK